jgi:Fe2+ transport system protein FeoA
MMDEIQPRPLSGVSEGETVTIVAVNAGQGLKSRLAVMGLMPRTQIKVMNNGHPGPFVVGVKNARIMLGRGMADKILVR